MRRISAMTGRRVMVSECLTMAPFFLNGVEERWSSGFVTMGSCKIFASWKWSRAAYRAVKTPPPFCLGGPPVLIPPATDECEDEAPERPYICPECNGAFETLRQLAAHQTHKHGYRHPPGHRHSDQHVCMVSEHLQGSTSDISSPSTITESGILYGKG